MDEQPLSDTKTAVVILNWNGEHFLKKFLPSVIKYSISDSTKVYVADNGSTDNSVSTLRKEFPEVELILFDKNHGFTGGYNKALNKISAKYFVLLNSDVEVSENWLNPLVQFMDENDTVAACQPKILSYHQKDYFEYAGAAGGFIDKFGYPFCRGRILDKVEKDEEQYNEPSEIFWATGACMFVRAELYKKYGGLDEDFFAHMEEIDLCWRLKNAGYSIYYIPDSKVYHVGGGALPNDSPRKLYLNFRNNLYLLYKNLNSSQLFIVIFTRLMLDGISALMYLAGLKFKSFIAVFKAHVHFYRHIPELRKKRSSNQLKLNQIKEIYPKSIVFGYFLKKRHYFRSLKF